MPYQSKMIWVWHDEYCCFYGLYYAKSCKLDTQLSKKTTLKFVLLLSFCLAYNVVMCASSKWEVTFMANYFLPHQAFFYRHLISPRQTSLSKLHGVLNNVQALLKHTYTNGGNDYKSASGWAICKYKTLRVMRSGWNESACVSVHLRKTKLHFLNLISPLI